MNIKYLTIYLFILPYSIMAYSSTKEYYKEISASILVNNTLNQLAYDNCKNIRQITASKSMHNGTKFQEGGTIDYERGRTKILEKRAAKDKAKEQEREQSAKEKKKTLEQISIFGTIGLLLLLFVSATTIFCIFYIKEKNNNKIYNP